MEGDDGGDRPERGDDGEANEGMTPLSIPEVTTHTTDSEPPRKPPNGRPHSSSISSVRFVDPPSRKSSTASLRTQSLRAATNANTPVATTPAFTPPRPAADPRQPYPPISTPPSRSDPFPQVDDAVSPRTTTPRASPSDQLRPFPNGNGRLSPSANANSATMLSPGGSVVRRSSQDRRVRSEGVPHRPGPLLAHGKRPSVVTGGYESSTDDTSESSPDGPSTQPTRLPLPSSSSFSAHRGLIGLGLGEGRRRAQSLMSPIESVRSPTPDASSSDLSLSRPLPSGLARGSSFRPGGGVGGGPASRHASRDPLRPSGLRSPHTAEPLATQPTRISSQRSARSALANLPPSRSDSIMSAGPSRVPSRVLDARSPRVNGDRGGDGAASPSRKGKEREDRNANGLAASLGLGASSRDVALTADQIHDLLNDTDVSSALRLMSNPLHAARLAPPSLETPSLSPKSSRPHSPVPPPPPENRTKPFIASAPPPLTGGHHRDRTISVASTIAPPPRATWSRGQARRDLELASPSIVDPGHRRRSSFRASTEAEGHVPFTHHVTVTEDAVSDDEDEDVGEIGDVGSVDAVSVPTTVEDGTDVQRRGSQKSSKKEAEVKRKRFTHLFSIKRRKSEEVAATPPRDHRPEQQKSNDHAKEKEKHEREIEMRRKELERREAELAEERRFKALTQVAAHPDAERLAYRASSHLHAFYNLVYDGIENPPKMDPLAVLRWKMKSEEQAEAKAAWERRHNANANGNGNGNGNGNENGIGSPYKPWTGAIHASPGSFGSSSRLGRDSNDLVRLSSGGSGKHWTRSPVPRKVSIKPDPSTVAKNWRYTVEDVEAYNACGGSVNYFIPPREPLPRETSDRDREAGTSMAHGSTHSVNGGPSVNGKNNMDEEGSSVAESSKKGDHAGYTARVTSASTASLAGPPLSRENSIALSRTTSIETGKIKNGSARRISHRPHQSLGGPSSLGHALKVPFEKLGSVARKQRTMPHMPAFMDHPYDSNQESSPARQPVSSLAALTLANGSAAAGPSRISHLAPPTPVHPSGSASNDAVSANSKTRERLFRRSHDPTHRNSITDDERHDREFHLRKLFLKGERLPFGSPFGDKGRSVLHRFDSDKEPTKYQQRQDELRALEAALQRESAFRLRQAETTRRTQLEHEASERIKDVEAEIYAERAEQLGSVRRRLENVDVSLETADESMRHYFSQIDQFTAVAKITCGVDMRWQDVEPLRKAYSSRRISGSFGDDHRDHRVVSGDLHDSPGSDANAQRRVSPRLSPRQTVSPVLGAAGTGAPMPKPPKRKSTIASTMPSLFHLNLTPWPRRSYLDPSGTTRVDPIRMAELTLEDVRRRAGEVGTLRRGARESLQGMIAEVDGLIRQKDQVRAWTKNALGKHRLLEAQVDQLRREARGDSSARMARIRDSLTDKAVRLLVSPLFKTWYTVIAFFLMMIGVRSVSKDKDGGKAGWRGVVWTGVRTAVVVGVVAYFWYLGG